MASQKKKRKAQSLERRQNLNGPPPRKRDGDRRGKALGAIVRRAKSLKQAMQSGDIPIPEPDTPIPHDFDV